MSCMQTQPFFAAIIYAIPAGGSLHRHAGRTGGKVGVLRAAYIPIALRGIALIREGVCSKRERLINEEDDDRGAPIMKEEMFAGGVESLTRTAPRIVGAAA